VPPEIVTKYLMNFSSNVTQNDLDLQFDPVRWMAIVTNWVASDFATY